MISTISNSKATLSEDPYYESSAYAKVDKWHLVQQLGKDNTSRTFLCYDKALENFGVMKISIDSEPLENYFFKSEVNIRAQLNHEHILAIEEVHESIDIVCLRRGKYKISAMISKLALGGNIVHLIGDTRILPELIARTYFVQIIDALEYLHKNNIAHRYIKLQNLLLDQDFSIKITNFSCSSKTDKNKMFTKWIGDLKYFTPEMHAKKKYCAIDADIFATGICIFAMVFGHMPFLKASEGNEQYELLIKEIHENFWKVHEAFTKEMFFQNNMTSINFEVSHDFRNLMERMLSKQPSKRLTIAQIKKHSWYCGPVLSRSKLLDAVVDLILERNKPPKT